MAYFFIVIISILLGSHFFVYYILTILFGVTKYKLILLIIFVILALSFIKTSVLIHEVNNSFTRFFYYLSSVWLGILSNLFFTLILVSVILGITKIIHTTPNLKLLGIISIIFSISLALYGIYNANNIVVKQENIKIKNIPENWKKKKVIFLSDIHLGAIIRENFLKKIVDTINKEKPDIVLIGGDLFDGTDGSLDHLSDYLNNIKTKNGVYYINGNHETYLGLNLVDKLLKNTNIKNLKDEIISIDGVQIIGIDYIDERDSKSNIQKTLDKIKKSGFDKNTPSILLYHAPIFTEEFNNLGVNLQLSGHTHKGQIFPYGYITNLMYKQKDYGLYKNKNYNLYTSNGVGTWGPPMRIGNNPEIVVLKFN
ncbi:MAG: metallophosphoesterase [Candidatus Gracilibacteria bacterium]|nr:metallophosphoesterase [Candidatus Gracilibacteria bacterium]